MTTPGCRDMRTALKIQQEQENEDAELQAAVATEDRCRDTKNNRLKLAET